MTGRKPVTRISATFADASLASSVTHDFSQPLSIVTSLADLLATDWASLTEHERRDLTARIDGASRVLATRFRQMAMAMDLLGGRIRPGGSVDVRAAVDAVTASIPARVGVAGPSVIAAIDRDHLEHALATLLADVGEPVRVRCVPGARSIAITVTDHHPDAVRATSTRVLTSNGWKGLRRPAPRYRAVAIALVARLVAIDGGVLTGQRLRDRRGTRLTVHLPGLRTAG
ncbi:MAG TPA: hypothetical protein VGJ28_27105 [Micromonosporaceae bacterium]|jgi:multidrug efflux pump subunit AcrA (membrane-fusion protein)